MIPHRSRGAYGKQTTFSIAIMLACFFIGASWKSMTSPLISSKRSDWKLESKSSL